MARKFDWPRYLVYRWWHDKLPLFIVYHLLPKRIVMWAAVRVGAHATTGEYSNQVVPELYFVDALKRWETA